MPMGGAEKVRIQHSTLEFLGCPYGKLKNLQKKKKKRVLLHEQGNHCGDHSTLPLGDAQRLSKCFPVFLPLVMFVEPTLILTPAQF